MHAHRKRKDSVHSLFLTKRKKEIKRSTRKVQKTLFHTHNLPTTRRKKQDGKANVHHSELIDLYMEKFVERAMQYPMLFDRFHLHLPDWLE